MSLYYKGKRIAGSQDGKSAYELAVENGFVGTEQEWLESLKGTQVDLSNYYTKQDVDKLKEDLEAKIPDVIKRCTWIYSAGDDISLFAENSTNVASFDEFIGCKPDISNGNIGLILVDNKLYWTKFDITAINESADAAYQTFTQDPILIGPINSVDELLTVRDTDVRNISQLPANSGCFHFINSFLFYKFNDDIVYVRNDAPAMSILVNTMDGKRLRIYYDETGQLDFNNNIISTSVPDESWVFEYFYDKTQIDNKIANAIAEISVDDELITIKDTSITNISQLPVDKLPCCFHMVNSDVIGTNFKDDIIYISRVTLGEFSVYTIDGVMINMVCDEDDGTISFDKFLHWVDDEVLLSELSQFYKKNEVDNILDEIKLTQGDGITLEDDTINVTRPVQTILTQAEFDALPEEQQNKGLYVISDGGSGGSGNAPTGGASIPCGVVWIWSGTTAPDGWVMCDGTVYQISEYPTLAEFFEQQHGAKNFFGGDGITTFAVPNLSGQFVLGESESHAIGSTGGAEGVTLTVEQMPTHNHSISYKDQTFSSGSEASRFVSSGMSKSTYTGFLGSSEPHENMPPYLTLTYIIKL